MTRAAPASRLVPHPSHQATVPATIDDLLARARSGLARLDPAAAFQAIRGGAVLIDTRPDWQRRADGEIPGAIVIERNHLEWRCDPSSRARAAEAADHQVAWIICCEAGYSPSLTAASLQALGLSRATDVIGGSRRGAPPACRSPGPRHQAGHGSRDRIHDHLNDEASAARSRRRILILWT